jgi:sarcosine oxidase / L-pipecolate oxidase
VLFNCERGFFMEPDEDCRDLKICDEHPGYCNWIDDGQAPSFERQDGMRDVPFEKRQVPKEAEDRVRLFLRETMPQLADRPFSFARICWCADTPDRNFLIDHHPDYSRLTLAVGGSGHGYVYISAIGDFIVDEMEGRLNQDMQHLFRWRPETAVARDWKALQGRYGPEGSSRVMDLAGVREWTHIP